MSRSADSEAGSSAFLQEYEGKALTSWDPTEGNTLFYIHMAIKEKSYIHFKDWQPCNTKFKDAKSNHVNVCIVQRSLQLEETVEKN